MTTQPGFYDFTIYKGATFSELLTWKDENGALINLIGYSAQFTGEGIDRQAPFLNLTTANGGITLGGSAGTITVSMNNTATAALIANDGIYNLELTAPDGSVTRLLEGHLYIAQEVA